MTVGFLHGTRPLTAEEIGDGRSNLSFLLRRGPERLVLRRPPRGKLSASANDVLREARMLRALAATRVPVPDVLARCEDPKLIGAPFVMSFVEGTTVNDGLPAELDTADAPRRIVAAIVAAFADLHAAELEGGALAEFGRRSGYLERQLRIFRTLLETNATHSLPDLERVVDLDYCTVMWAEPDDPRNPMFDLSQLTAGPGFRGRGELARAYAEATGRDLGALPWYQVLALRKSAIFLKGCYRRYATEPAPIPTSRRSATGCRR